MRDKSVVVSKEPDHKGITVGVQEKNLVTSTLAEKVSRLVREDGMTLKQATTALGVHSASLLASEKVSLEELIAENKKPPEQRREMVRAGLDEIFLKTVRLDPELALKAAKQIAEDPEVGLSSSQMAQVLGLNIDLRSLEEPLKNLPAISIRSPDKEEQ